MNKKVLLLGATGFLGRNVLRELLRREFEVVALVRDRKNAVAPILEKELTQLPCYQKLSIVEGSLLSPKAILDASQGCDAVVNCSGTTDMSLLKLADYYPVNRDAVGFVIEAMKNHGISTLVHVSTANTIGYGTSERWATEASPIENPFAESFYAQSKKAGEERVLQFAEENKDAHVIVVNPGFMLGPYDLKPSSGQLLMAANRRPVLVAPKGGKSFIHVGDAACAIVNAIDRGENGSKYLLTGKNMSLKEFYRMQAEVCGYRQKVLDLPNGLALAGAKIGDLLRLCGIRTQLATRNVRQLLVMEWYDNSHTCKELDMPETPIAKAIKDFFDYR